MSVKVIAELHPLRSARIKCTVTSKPIADIITELNSGFPLSQARVCRNGEIVRDFSINANDGDMLAIKFVPYGNPQQAGVGMKVGGWALVIAGVVLIATGYGSAIGAAIIGAGIGMLAGGTVLMNMNMNLNIPSLKDREKPENDPSVRGSRNQARPHGRIPVLFGRHRLYPDIAANPHTQIIDGKQYYTQLLCGGYKDYVIDVSSFKLGETYITELSQTKNIASILAGADPVIRLEIMQNGERSNIYPDCVHEDAVNAPLKNTTDEGLPGAIIRTTPEKTDSINIDIFLPNGIGKYNSEGDLESESVTVRALYKKADEPDSAYQVFGSFGAITGAELKTKRYQITKSGLAPGSYTVKIERLTSDSKDLNVVDQVYLGSVRSSKSVRPIRAERQKDLTFIAMRVLATSQLNGILERFNYVATSKLPVYSGTETGRLSWLETKITRNPAAMLLYALQGRAAQQSVDSGDIDWPSFGAFYIWCEEHGYTCNAYLSEAVTIADMLRMIGNTSRADVLRIDSKVSVVQDIERYSPVQLFTPKNTVGYSVTMFNADVPDSVSLRYIDEDAGFTQNELSVYHTPDGNRVKEPDSIQKLDLWGITNSIQARRIGMYNYACLKNRPFVHTIEVDIEYLMCNKGDWIQYAGDLALTGSIHGRVIEPLFADGRCVGIRADEPVETVPDRQYAVRLRKSDGTVLLKNTAVIRKPDEIYFVEPFDVNDAPGSGDVYAFGVRGMEVLDLVITDIQPGQNLSASLTCVEYSPAIFGVDAPDFVLPEFENKITPVSGAVDSGIVNPNRWRLFITYHDSDYEPPWPAGDGQNGGWHYAQTLRSVWQSSKNAEAVDQGEWGPPVRIRNTRDNTDVIPIYLTLSPQRTLLECDGDGNILAGILPLTVQADLYMWNMHIAAQVGILHYPSGAADLFVPVFGEPRYPGNVGGLFSPMLGDFYPSGGEDIEFSLFDAPDWITINGRGTITIAADAELDDENSVTVQARYRGETYTAVLFIGKDTSRFPARYLGTITTLPAAAAVFIIKGPVQGQVRARQGDYVLAVADGYAWQKGYVYQWTGTAWEKRAPDQYTDLYIRCFKDGLDVPELTQDMGWFGALFARILIAQQAFIEELSAQVITLKGGGMIQSATTDPVTGEPLIVIRADGSAGFRNIDIAGTSIFRGSILSGPLSLLSEEPIGPTFTYPIGTNPSTIPNVTRPVTGDYGGVPIILVQSTSLTEQTGIAYNYYRIMLTTNTASVVYGDGATSIIARTISQYTRWPEGTNSGNVIDVGLDKLIEHTPTSNVLTFRYSEPNNKIMKLIGIPDYKPIETGIVYRSGNSLMIS